LAETCSSAADVPAIDGIAKRSCVNTGDIAVDKSGSIEFSQDRHDAAGAMDILQMDVGD
jgi:hypothetical protein